MDKLLTSRQNQLPDKTNCFRLINGLVDGFENIFVDSLADYWLISTKDRAIPAQLLSWLKKSNRPIFHKTLDVDNKLAPTQIAGPEASLQFLVQENGVFFHIDLSTGYSQGLFLDQRENRQKVRKMVSPGEKILNTFAYTGAFSVYAALGGATTTTLDLAQPCLDTAKQNFLANSLDPNQHHFCKGDTLHWLDRFIRQNRKFNGIILDPPTFSRDQKGKVFRVERDYGMLAAKAFACLEPRGWLLCTTNCRKLSHSNFANQLADSLPISTKFIIGKMPFDFHGDDYLKIVWCFAK